MFMSFFGALREACVPVSPREYLVLKQAIDPDLADRSFEQFYHLSRALLVKNERHLDAFDRVFVASFKSLLSLADAVAAREIPAD